MWRYRAWALVGALTLIVAARSGRAAEELSLEQVNQAERPTATAKGPSPGIIRAQVLLDRAFVSPGVIDGYWGGNTEKAIRVYQHLQHLSPSGELDTATWASLTSGSSTPALTTYTISKRDAEGPFTEQIPSGMKEMAKLDRLGYTSPAELLAEKFHLDQDLLKALNPDVDFSKPGTKIVVANVRGRKPKVLAASVVVDRTNQAVKAFSQDGRLIAFYPATVGSDTFPSPSGDLKVTAIAEDPVFTYSGKLEYSDLKKGEAIQVAPGPNNPVGNIWIDLSKDGYGIHGTPSPSKISKSASHGCVRLTNWSARELAFLVKPGVPVRFH